MESEEDMPVAHNDENDNNDDDNDDDGHDDDTTPIFLTAGNGLEEVPIDDHDVPMEDDDDDDAQADMDDPMHGGFDVDNGNANVLDMSQLQIQSHTGPVYAIASHWDEAASQLSIVSGGGDDKAYLHHCTTTAFINNRATTTTTATTATTPTTTTETATTLQSILLPVVHTDSVSCVAYNLQYRNGDPNSPSTTTSPRLMAVGGYDGAIVVYDADSGSVVQTFEGPTDVEWICFHPVGGTVLLAGSGADGTVWMYHVPLRKCLQVFVGHEKAVTAGNFSPNGRWALTCSADGTLRMWAPKTGISKHVFRFNGDGSAPFATNAAAAAAAGLTCIGINGAPDGQLVVVGAEDGWAHVCHLGSKKVITSLRHFDVPIQYGSENTNNMDLLPTSVEAVSFAPQAVNPYWCATGGVDGVLKIWDLSSDAQCRQICRPPPPPVDNNTNEEQSMTSDAMSGGGITRLVWHPHLPWIFAAYTSGIIRLWDARNGQLLHTLTGHTNVINDIMVHIVDEGKTAVLITASDDKTVRVFSIDMTPYLQR